MIQETAFLVVKRGRGGRERASVEHRRAPPIHSGALLIFDLIGGRRVGGKSPADQTGEIIKRHLAVANEGVDQWGRKRTAELLPN